MAVDYLMMHKPWEHTEDIADLFEDGRVTNESVKRALRESLEEARTLEALAKKKGIEIVEPFWGVTGYGTLRVLGPTVEYFESLLPDYRGTPQPKQDAGTFAQFFKEAAEAVKTLIEGWGFETLSDAGETSAENNSSAILLFTIAGESLLFTADAGIPALSQAVFQLQREGFDFSKLTFIQVPHHGSQRNIGPSLLDIIIGPKIPQEKQIKIAFLSVSPDGAPKHPAKKVTNAFLRRGTPVHATSGKTKRHSKRAPDRDGWINSTALPFYQEVEE